MIESPLTSVYLILRNHWEAAGDRYACINEPGEGVPVVAYRERDHAEARREELEHFQRLKGDPQHYPRVSLRSTGVETDQIDMIDDRSHYLADDNKPRRSSDDGGAGWWHTHKHTLTPEEVREHWNGLDGGQFHEVICLELYGHLTENRTVCVVRRLAWVWDHLGLHMNRAGDFHGHLYFGKLECAFADRVEAEDFRRQADRRARVGQNPFAYACESADPIAGRASLEFPHLRDWLLDCGLPSVPKVTAGADVWIRWWQQHAPNLSPLQQAKAWEAFDRVRFYDIVEVNVAD